MGKKILVIGGTGATGIPLVEGLNNRGHEVVILHRGLHEKGVPQDIEHIHCDPHWIEPLEEALSNRSFDVVIATYGRLRYIADVVKGKTEQLISAGGALPIYKGWMQITNDYPWETMEESPIFVHESHPLASMPVEDTFSIRAREAESAVLRAHNEKVYSVTHFRYPIVYGPHSLIGPEWPIIRRIQEGRKKIILPNGGSTILSRGYSYNVAHALLLAVDKPQSCSGEIYNVCDDQIISNAEWIRLVIKIMEADIELIDIPFSLLPEKFHSSSAQLLFPKHRIMSIEKLKTQLGYRDVFSVEDAVQNSVNWLLDNPTERGKDIDKNIQDSYDYALEDAVIERFNHIKSMMKDFYCNESNNSFVWRHPYPHPKNQGDLR